MLVKPLEFTRLIKFYRAVALIQMGEEGKRKLIEALNLHLNNIRETFQLLDQNPASSLEKVSWEEVVKMGEQVSKQATIAGMVWTGDRLEVTAIEENMGSFFNILQGFLLLSHGSQVGAGVTLSAHIHSAVKQVVDCSFRLWKEAISSYVSKKKDQKLSIPPLVGAVWEACSGLKKIPSTNITAIGRAMTQVAVSVKDVLREMKELKPGTSNSTEETSEESPSIAEIQSHDDSNSSESDIGNDLSPEEMKVAQLATRVVAETLVVIKELIRAIMSLLKVEKVNQKSDFVASLENLLKLCQEIGVEIDELGACIYPPQEIPIINGVCKKNCTIVDAVQEELESLGGSSEAFLQACCGLKTSFMELNSVIGVSSAVDLESKMQNVALRH